MLMNRQPFFETMLKGVIFCLLLSLALPAYALTPNDEYFDGQWHFQTLGLEQAWDTETGDNSIVVAVLDTGVDLDHPDLVDNLWRNGDEIAGDGLDNDGNGYIDDVHGWDYVGQDGDPAPDEGIGSDVGSISHGTFIAGTIGAVTDNESGVAGVNWNVKIMSVRILDNHGVGGSTLARRGVEYATANGADVINLSFTGYDRDDRFRDAIRDAYEAGIVVVAAVGNTSGGGTNVDNRAIFPACFGERADEDWILGVASTDEDDVKSDFSNYGSICTDISAPGENIMSTIYQNDDWAGFEEYYETGWSGTSMAAPMVAGAAALIKAAHPTFTPNDIKSILRLSVDPVTAYGDARGKMGTGRLNIANAMALAPMFDDEVEETEISDEVAVSNLIKKTCEADASVSDPCRAVYYYADDGYRHAFPNEKIFFTWFDDFDDVIEVSGDILSDIPLGKNVTYHPGTKMVKFLSVPTVYAVAAQGELRAIVSEEVAIDLYGDDWNQQIDDISDAFLGNYSFGEDIESADDYDVDDALSSVSSLDDNF